ncbi:hypothetical protein MY005_49930 [Escherichia coli]|nr:hypothetical protein MY005_49930 [Escherichia coli]
MRNALPGAGSKVSGKHAADAGYLVPGRDSGTLLTEWKFALTDHEIRTVLARMEDIPEDQRTGVRYFFRRGDGDYQQRERKPPGDRPC